MLAGDLSSESDGESDDEEEIQGLDMDCFSMTEIAAACDERAAEKTCILWMERTNWRIECCSSD